jgi:hypothetical protein
MRALILVVNAYADLGSPLGNVNCRQTETRTHVLYSSTTASKTSGTCAIDMSPTAKPVIFLCMLDLLADRIYDLSKQFPHVYRYLFSNTPQ